MNPKKNNALKSSLPLGERPVTRGVVFCAGDKAPATPEGCQGWRDAFMVGYDFRGICKETCQYTANTITNPGSSISIKMD